MDDSLDLPPPAPDPALETLLRLAGRWKGACIYCGRPRCNMNAAICHYCARVELFARKCPCGRLTREDLNGDGEWQKVWQPPRPARFVDAECVTRIVEAGGGPGSVQRWMLYPRDVAERAWEIASESPADSSELTRFERIGRVLRYLRRAF